MRMSNIGRFRMPAVAGEPMRHYPPGSTDAAGLAAACKKIRSEVVEIPCIIDGEEYFTGDVFEQTICSDHQHVIARVHRATPELVQKAIDVTNSARKEWASLPVEHRLMIFRKAADLLSGPHRFPVMASTMLGQGKTVWQAEIDSSVETIDFFRLNTGYVHDIYDVQPPLNSPNTWNRLEYRELEGFVLAISPFNFTAIGANLATAPAMMGNTVIWKPAATASLSNYYIMKLLQDSGLPKGVISFLPCADEDIAAAVTHPDLAGLHFTGSTRTFNKLWQTLGENLNNYKSYPRIVGETGGKNFHMVHPSADMEHTVYSTVRGAFEYQGQKCSASSLKTTKELKVGQSDDWSVFVSAVIDENAWNKHVGYIEGVKSDPNCEILVGGTYDKSRGWFIDPTIVETKNSQNICAEADKTSPFGLTGSIFCTDRYEINKAAEILRHAAGNLYINDKSTGAVVGEQPFGGARVSGTNDKAGAHLNLLRWVSARTIKETTVPLRDYKYPYLEK
eukprot:GSChrysophyteH1.ASY1.ANO1.372.1 assembled CDS